MAKLTVAGQAVVVTSSIKLEDLRTIKKYRPDALTLYEGTGAEKEPVFAIGIGNGNGGINAYGVEFANETRDAEKKASLTVLIPEEISDAKKYVSDKYGAAILKLNRLEETLSGALHEIAEEKAMIEENITVIQ